MKEAPLLHLSASQLNLSGKKENTVVASSQQSVGVSSYKVSANLVTSLPVPAGEEANEGGPVVAKAQDCSPLPAK